MSVSSGDLKELIRQVLRENQAKAPPQEPAEGHAHHVSECPECLEESIKMLKAKSEYQCKDCAFPLGNEKMMKELKGCPSCGRTNSAVRRRF